MVYVSVYSYHIICLNSQRGNQNETHGETKQIAIIFYKFILLTAVI